MITVLGMWESDWMEAERTERRLWKQTVQAFAVDEWAMCGVKGGPFTSPLQFEDSDSLISAYPGPKVFLISPHSLEGGINLVDYQHPDNAIYVFGNSYHDLIKYVTPGDDVVSIYTPTKATMFGHVALSAVLYDRLAKQ